MAIRAEEDLYLAAERTGGEPSGALRAEAEPLTRRHFSTTDTQVVALSEERSFRCAVTIVTGDPRDIDLLVGLTRQTNIAVDVFGGIAPPRRT